MLPFYFNPFHSDGYCIGKTSEFSTLNFLLFQSIFYYVFCHPSSPDSFEITTNFPKRVLKCRGDLENGGNVLTLAQAGLLNREVLFINDLDA